MEVKPGQARAPVGGSGGRWGVSSAERSRRLDVKLRGSAEKSEGCVETEVGCLRRCDCSQG